MARKKKSASKKAPKKVKLPVIRRRLMRKWSEKVRGSTNGCCAVCGMQAGEIINGKKQKVEAHHLVSRDIHNSAMKFNILNGIPLCTHHHKFGHLSAHKNMIWFTNWLAEHRPLQHTYVLEHHDHKINLNNREVLTHIEEQLGSPWTDEEKDIVNLEDMNNIEEKRDQFLPFITTTTTTTTSSLFDNIG